MRCAICYLLYNFKNVKNNHGGVLYKWYQIAQRITYGKGYKYHEIAVTIKS